MLPRMTEVIYFLEEFDAPFIGQLKQEFPELSSEITSAGEGGLESSDPILDLEKAKLILRSLGRVRVRSEHELLSVIGSIRAAHKYRLFAQVATLVGSSSILAVININEKWITIGVALMTLCASLWVNFAEYRERMFTPGEGDIYAVFEKASGLVYRAGILSEELHLLIRHARTGPSLHELVAEANQICHELAPLLAKMSARSVRREQSLDQKNLY